MSPDLAKIYESFINLTAQNATLIAEVASMGRDLKDLKLSLKEHENSHADLAKQKDVDALGELNRALEARVKELEDAPGRNAMEQKKKTAEWVANKVGQGTIILIGGGILYFLFQIVNKGVSS